MQTSRFQLGLMAALAMSLGFVLASSDAVGYPSGPVVSTGENPSWSAAGVISDPTTRTLVTAPTDQDAMVVDLYLATNYGSHSVRVELLDGTLVGQYYVTPDNPVVRSMNAGVRVPRGQALYLTWSSGYNLYYSASGYHAQP